MAKKVIAGAKPKKVKVAEVVETPKFSVEEVENLEVLKFIGKTIKEINHITVGISKVEDVIARLVDRGYIDGAGSRIWLTPIGLTVIGE